MPSFQFGSKRDSISFISTGHFDKVLIFQRSSDCALTYLTFAGNTLWQDFYLVSIPDFSASTVVRVQNLY